MAVKANDIVACISKSVARQWSSPCTQHWLGHISSHMSHSGPVSLEGTLKCWTTSREGDKANEGSGAQVS